MTTTRLKQPARNASGVRIILRRGLYLALGMIAADARQLTLIAYNRERDADGPVGTAHLVNVAAKWGYKTTQLDVANC